MVIRSLLPSLESSLFGTRTPSLFGADLGREIARAFDDAMRGFPSYPNGLATMALRLDVKEDEKSFTVTADMPGLTEKDVEITFEDDTLTIRGEKKNERDETVGTWHLVERSSGSFARQLALPVAIDAEKCDATFSNGVLTITLPKKTSEESKAKKITIKGG